jgi:hypothetical protein
MMNKEDEMMKMKQEERAAEENKHRKGMRREK